VILGILVLVAAGLFGVLRDGSFTLPGTTGATPAPSAAPGTALEVLESIAVKGKSPRTGYDREENFGSAWIDVDGNGCDTRNDILARDLTDIVLGENCRVLSGVIDDPYTGDLISFVRGNDTSALVQIDHVVALSNAWQTGAQQITEEKRIALANDPINLLAVDGSANSQKGDGDTATWLPENTAFRCEYVARQISVKARYALWVTAAEHDAMVRVLSRCPDQVAFAG
jgi:hypothetical protein